MAKFEKNSKIIVSLTPTWDIIEKIRNQVRENLAGIGDDTIEASEMTASELTENAVKYGISRKNFPQVGFMFEYNNERDEITIEVTNGVWSEREVERTLGATIDKINNAEDKAVLYTSRLMELLENPQPGVSQLGLLRIAYEGGFDLDYNLKDHIVKVRATKKL